MRQHDDELDSLFAAYREACPEPEPSPEFMARIWERIQSGRSDVQHAVFWLSFGRITRSLAAFAAAACLLLGLLDLTNQQRSLDLSYPDALAVSSTAESTNYAEGLHIASENDH